jgi:hypothetical protein
MINPGLLKAQQTSGLRTTRRTIIITALCGGVLVGSVIGGSYMIATAIRQAGDRQVDAIQRAADQQSLATEQVSERAYQQAVDRRLRELELRPLSSYGR